MIKNWLSQPYATLARKFGTTPYKPAARYHVEFMEKINMQLEVGKTYTTRGGDTVEITEEAGGTFVGKVTRKNRPGLGTQFFRTYFPGGRLCPVYIDEPTGNTIDMRDDIMAEHVEKPPFELKVGEVYPTRDGKGFGFTVGQSAFVEGTFCAVVFAGGLAVNRTYWADGRSIRNADNPTDLVEGPIRGDYYAFIKAMAVREVMRLALDIASGKRSVANYAWSPDVMHVMTMDGRRDRPLQSGTATFTGSSFTVEVQHGGVNS